MEISHIHKVKKASDPKMRKKAVDSSGFFGLINMAADEEKSVHDTELIQNVSHLFALQEAKQSNSLVQHNIDRGYDILNQLEALKNSLLSGGINKSILLKIKDTLHSMRTKTHEQQLEDLISEIELRAHVELAKYESN